MKIKPVPFWLFLFAFVYFAPTETVDLLPRREETVQICREMLSGLPSAKYCK